MQLTPQMFTTAKVGDRTPPTSPVWATGTQVLGLSNLLPPRELVSRKLESGLEVRPEHVVWDEVSGRWECDGENSDGFGFKSYLAPYKESYDLAEASKTLEAQSPMGNSKITAPVILRGVCV